MVDGGGARTPVDLGSHQAPPPAEESQCVKCRRHVLLPGFLGGLRGTAPGVPCTWHVAGGWWQVAGGRAVRQQVGCRLDFRWDPGPFQEHWTLSRTGVCRPLSPRSRSHRGAWYCDICHYVRSVDLATERPFISFSPVIHWCVCVLPGESSPVGNMVYSISSN